MNQRFEKSYVLNEYQITVFFSDRLISIGSPFELKSYLSSNTEPNTTYLVKLIKVDYENIFHKPLLISDSSFSTEIYGHLWASYMATFLKSKLKFTQRLADFVINRSDQIDCGERTIDSNRLIWDLLAPFRRLFIPFLRTMRKN